MTTHEDAFPTLDADDIAVLDALGVRESIAVGDCLYRSGDETYDFFVLVSGAVDVVLDDNGQERTMTRHGAGKFLGELNLLTGQRAFLSARVAEPGEVIRIPAQVARQVLASHAHLGDTILTALIARRANLLAGATASVRLIGSRHTQATRELGAFLARSRIPHEWLDPERDPPASRLLSRFALGAADLPAVVTGATVLRRASPGLLAEHLGLAANVLSDRCVDLVIVGSGPAGLAAAVYGASEGLRTVAVETLAVGGQAATSSRIENYFGFPAGVGGAELTQLAAAQAQKFGARLASPCAATLLREEAGRLVVGLADGTELAGRAVIAATGARYRRLDLERLETFEGAGVYYAATEMEARACAGRPVVIVGGGNSAGQAAMFLAEAGCQVTIVIRKPHLGTDMSRYLVDRLHAHPSVDIHPSSLVTALLGGLEVSAVRVLDPGGSEVLACVGLFSFIGAEPSSEWLSGCAAVDDRGFVLTDRALDPSMLDHRWQPLTRRPLPFETSQPGLFAVGDVRSGSTKRVAAAVGEGSAAVRSVHEHLRFDPEANR